MTRAIDESRARRGNDGQLDGHRVSVSNRSPLKARGTFNTIRLAEQLTDCDLRFTRMRLPFRDGIRHRIVESKQARRGQPPTRRFPKSFLFH